MSRDLTVEEADAIMDASVVGDDDLRLPDEKPADKQSGAKIIAITKKQAEIGRKMFRDWRDRALAHGPDATIRSLAEEGLKNAYRASGLEAPTIKWYESPLKGLAAATFQILGGLPTITGRLYEEPCRSIDGLLGKELDHKVYNVLTRELQDSIGDRAADIAQAVSTELAIRSSVIGDTKPKVSKVLDKLLERVVFGAHDAGKLALYEFCIRHLGVSVSDQERDLVLALGQAAFAGWYWPFEKLVIATDLPLRLQFDDAERPHCRSGPAVEYAGDFSVYCRHGVRIPREAVESGVGWDDIKVTADPVVKTALAEEKAEKWSEKSEKPGESAEDRLEAALAVKRLGGMSSLQELVEDKEDAPERK